MRSMMATALALAAGLLAATGMAGARDLPVPADKGWKHAETGLILRSRVLGLPRTRLEDSRNDERDVAAQFNDPALDTSATVYIFKPALMSVPIWFDRADYAASHRADNGGATPVGPAMAFAPPRTTVAAALRRLYVPRRGYRSDALAVLPLGDWLVAIRLSSRTLDPAALDQQLTRVIAEIGWPVDAAPPMSVAVPVAPCPSTLKTRHASTRPPDMSQMLFGAVLAGMKPGEARTVDTPATAEAWCRDRDLAERYGVYRKPSLDDAYVIALDDSGRTIDVAPAPTLGGVPGMGKADGGFAPTLRDLGGETSLYARFDRLPDPGQVVDLVDRTAPASRVTPGADGKRDVSINASQLKK